MFQWLLRSHNPYPSDGVDITIGEDDDPATGIPTLSTMQALAIPAVYQCVSMISGDVSRMPITVTRAGSTEPMTGHRLYRPLRWRPRMGVNANQFWRRVLVNLLMEGEAHCEILPGSPLELLELDPGSVHYDRNAEMYRVSDARRGSRPKVLSASELLRFELLSLRDDQPVNVQNVAQPTYGLTSIVNRYMTEFFARGGNTAGVLTVPPSMQEPTRRKVEAQFAGKRKQWFKTVVLREGNWHKTGNSLKDDQMIELNEHLISEIGRYFNIPPSRLGLKSAISFASSVEESNRYIRQTLAPVLQGLQSELEFKLLRADEWDRIHLRHDRTDLILGETADDPSSDDGTDVDEDTNRPDEEQGRRLEEPAAELV